MRSEAIRSPPRAAFVEAGARWLHVVDMDLAFTGEAVNAAIVVADPAMRIPMSRCNAAAGSATAATLDRLLAAGAARVVVGSAALADDEMFDGVIGDLATGSW